MTGLVIRPLALEDHADWTDLWRQYLAFYETELPRTVYVSTWNRLLSESENEFEGLIARDGNGTALGLAHYLFHRDCWAIEDTCYLQDLFVAPAARGTGVGRRLIEAIYADADARGGGKVYWTTQETNRTARLLYDRIAILTPFLKYQRNRVPR